MKKLFLLPFVAMFGLVGCGGGDSPAGPGGGWDPSATHAGTQADPFSTREAIAKMDEAGTGVVVSGPEAFIRGVVGSGSTVNQYHNWYFNLDFVDGGKYLSCGAYLSEELKPTVTETAGALDGKTIIIKGYMELYEGQYKVSYLPANVSPTGSKYTPTVVAIL